MDKSQNALSFTEAVKTYADAEKGRTIINQSLSDAQRASLKQPTSSTGTPDYQFAIKGATITSSSYNPDEGGVEVAIPANTPVQAPAAGVVISAGPDENGTPSLQIQHPNGSLTRLTGLNAFNVKVGDQVQRGEDVALSGSSGNQKSPSVFWSLQDAHNKPVDPTTAGLPPVDLTKITDENTLHTALDDMRSQITDPKLQDDATREMESIVRHNQQMANAQKAQTLQQATDAFYGYANQHGGQFSLSSIPAPIQSQIPPEALARFKEIAKTGSQGEDNVNTVAGFILHPETLTVANVQAARPNLSNGRYLSLLGQAKDMESAPQQRAQKVLAVSLDKDQLETTLSNNGLNNLVSPKSGSTDFQSSINLRTSVRDQIDAEQQRTGKPLDREAKQRIIDTTIMNTASVPGTLWGSKTEPVFQMKPEELRKAFVTVGNQRITLSSIPTDQRALAISALQRRGMPVTEQAIANLWVQGGKQGAKQ